MGNGSVSEMKFVSIILTCHNYENFVKDAIESVIAQTYKNYELIIIDDGSNDNSINIINEYRSLCRVKVISKQNGGQLSAFNEAVAILDPNSSVVFFIDADDVYSRDYVEKVMQIYDTHSDCDFVFCGVEYFGSAAKLSKHRFAPGDLGFSVVKTYFARKYIGNATTSISCKKDVLSKVLPLQNEEDWRVRADDCIVWGTSLVAAKKYYLAEHLVKYRIHGSNANYNVNFNHSYYYKREINICKLFQLILEKNNIVISDRLIVAEFMSIPNKSIFDMTLYLIVIFGLSIGLIAKVKWAVLILLHYFMKLKFPIKC